MPAAEGALTGHVSPAAVSLRIPVLPTKPLRTTSALAELLADVAEGKKLTPEVVHELRHMADLVLRATKETAKSVGRSMGLKSHGPESDPHRRV
ncbi:uncharacterized protein ACO6RY_15737 [Pungitius sinensis]